MNAKTLLFLGTFLPVFAPPASADTHPTGAACIQMGGTGMANTVNDGTGIVAVLNGPVKAARGEIQGQTPTETGMEMKMSHIFMDGSGGTVTTNDKVLLTKVVGRDNRFMLDITYHIDPSQSTGTLAGYKGVFNSSGLLDMATGKIVIRYSGQICK